MSSKNMEPGKVYLPTSPGSMTLQPEQIPSTSNISGLGHKVVPLKLLSLDRVFTYAVLSSPLLPETPRPSSIVPSHTHSHVEKGNIVPRPYIELIVEPVSQDPEKHPVPVLNVWHKTTGQDRLTSYGVACKEIATEGKEENPFFEHRNPGLQQSMHDRKDKSENRVGRPRGWIARTAWWKRGARRPNQYILHKKLTKGANPWWASAHKARWKTEGSDASEIGRTPQYGFWKYLPILGYQGWGTMEGEINVEDQYSTVGLDEIQWWVDTGLLNTNETITPNTLVEARCVDDYHWPGLKLVTNNCTWFRAEVDIEMESADPEAVKLVRQNGGSVTTRWRDEEGIVKEKTPWRFPVIAGGRLPPEELIRDVYSKEERGGYLTDHYQKKLRVTNLASPRKWSLLDKTPEEIGEIPPEKEELVAVPRARRARETSLQKKQDYFEDALAGTAGTAEGRLGKITPSSFYLWEYTYFMKQGPGHMGKREPPEGLEETQFPGYPYRDARFYSFVEADVCHTHVHMHTTCTHSNFTCRFPRSPRRRRRPTVRRRRRTTSRRRRVCRSRRRSRGS